MIVTIDKHLNSTSALLRRKSSGMKKGTRNSIQLAITCSKLTTETLEQDVKYVQS